MYLPRRFIDKQSGSCHVDLRNCPRSSDDLMLTFTDFQRLGPVRFKAT